MSRTVLYRDEAEAQAFLKEANRERTQTVGSRMGRVMPSPYMVSSMAKRTCVLLHQNSLQLRATTSQNALLLGR